MSCVVYCTFCVVHNIHQKVSRQFSGEVASDALDSAARVIKKVKIKGGGKFYLETTGF